MEEDAFKIIFGFRSVFSPNDKEDEIGYRRERLQLSDSGNHDQWKNVKEADVGQRQVYAKGKTPKVVKSRRKKHAMDIEAIRRELAVPCNCLIRCSKQFSPHEILYWRGKVHSLPDGEEKMQKIIEILKLSSNSLRKHEKGQLYRVNQKMCCRSFFINILLRVSVATITRAKRALTEDKMKVYSDAPRQYTQSVRGRVCEGFIHYYMESACDRDPTGLIYRMPVGISKLDLFSMYRITHEDGLQKSEFYKILADKFENLVFSKSQRFTKCTECHNYRILIEKEKDPNQRAALIERRNLHLREQQLEREAYYVRRAQAEMRPNAILSLILDGMDQNKTDLPHYALWNTPSGSGAMKLRTHIVGCIAHGRGKYFFVDHNEIPHDTNLTLSCLLKVLQKEAIDGVLPQTLYVQLDNTPRENKNRYFLGFMAYLVLKGYVDEVYISFLFVGHTHEDIDQCFSKISQTLKQKDAVTMKDLLSTIKVSQKPEPKVEQTIQVWDIKSWIEDSINPVDNITYPKLYRIFKDEAGHVTMKYKKTSAEDEWHPKPNERSLEIFKIDKDGLQISPSGIPKPVKPSIDEDEIKDLKRSILKDFKLAQFTEERQEWWEQFFRSPVHQHLEVFPTFKETRRNNDSASTLTSKEQELIQTYDSKRKEFKEVFTKQRGGNVDRRHFNIGEMVIFKTGQKEAKVGKVIEKSENKLDVQIYEKKNQQYVQTVQTGTVEVTACFPGGFSLTKSNRIPLSAKRKIDQSGLLWS